MPSNGASAESVFATLSKIPQPPPKMLTAKLTSVEPGSLESYYMLATYCFDLSRKLMYLTKVAGPYAGSIPADLAQTIDDDTNAINAPDNWRQRAEAAEAIMLRLHGELSGGQTS